MEKQRQSHQREYTLRIIRKVFMKLLHKKRVEKITVGELCEEAGINRSTFYRCYPDIYALMDEICEEYYKRLYQDMAAQYNPEGSFEDNAHQLILQAFEVTQQHKDVYRLLLCEQPSAGLLQRLTDAMYQMYMDAHKQAYPLMPDAETHYHFLVSGILGLWQSWLMDDCKRPKEEMAEIAKRHIGNFYNTLSSFYGKPRNYQD